MEKTDSLIKELWKIHHPGNPFTPEGLESFKKEVIPLLDLKKYPKTFGLPPNTSFELTTSRNRNLITSAKQEKLRQTVVGFFGMSVGSHAALTWMMESRADCIKIVDPDTIDATNLNRLRFGWSRIGKTKVSVVKKLLLDINPYAKVFTSSATDYQSVKHLFMGKFPLSAIVDEVDDLAGKALFRELAKKQHIPLIMAADIGDNIVLDIERWDLSPQPAAFLGRIPYAKYSEIIKLPPLEKLKLIIKLVGLEKNSNAMLDSLLSVGKTISTWPQLGATASISGGIITTTLKKIFTGEKVNSGRYYISLDDLLVTDFNSSPSIKKRNGLIDSIRGKFSL